MRTEELLRTMVRSYFIITTGVTVSLFVFCRIFVPDALFSLRDIGRILLMAFWGDLPYLIFLSPKELGRNQMLLRTALHALVLAGILLTCAIRWQWVDPASIAQVAVFLLSVSGVYALVVFMTDCRDKKLTEKINLRLKERYGP